VTGVIRLRVSRESAPTIAQRNSHLLEGIGMKARSLYVIPMACVLGRSTFVSPRIPIKRICEPALRGQTWAHKDPQVGSSSSPDTGHPFWMLLARPLERVRTEKVSGSTTGMSAPCGVSKKPIPFRGLGVSLEMKFAAGEIKDAFGASAVRTRSTSIRPASHGPARPPSHP
jgi:hypothetical protein